MRIEEVIKGERVEKTEFNPWKLSKLVIQEAIKDAQVVPNVKKI